MKADIHPEFKSSTVSCACGSVVKTFSTVGDVVVDICSACHPFYTGQEKMVDREGRVERFQKKYGLKK